MHLAILLIKKNIDDVTKKVGLIHLTTLKKYAKNQIS